MADGLVALFGITVVAVLAIAWAVLRGDGDQMANDTPPDESAETDRAGGTADSDLVNIDGLDQISADDLDKAQDRLEDKHGDSDEGRGE